jgi:hypothetical protein
VEGSSGSSQANGYPRCAEEIQAEADVCSCCGAELQPSRHCYCSADHKRVEVTASGSHSLCGGEVIDSSSDSRSLEGPAGGVVPAAAVIPSRSSAQPVGVALTQGPPR